MKPTKPRASGAVSLEQKAKAVMARLEAAHAAAKAAALAAERAEALRYAEAQAPTLALLKRLDEIRDRLATVDMADKAIAARVNRSRLHIAHIHGQLLESDGRDFDAWRFEFINALWWEIRAIPMLRSLPRKPRGALGAVQRALDALLDENPGPHTTDAVQRLNKDLPGHGLTRPSVTTALSKAKARRRKP